MEETWGLEGGVGFNWGQRIKPNLGGFSLCMYKYLRYFTQQKKLDTSSVPSSFKLREGSQTLRCS